MGIKKNVELFCDGFKMRHQTVFITYFIFKVKINGFESNYKGLFEIICLRV